ncbi:MAG: hypothetical protein KDA32_11085 [Phycisphaerales bacterium]|nr:hypothetical protein [Phycisphaerales bacterium]
MQVAELGTGAGVTSQRGLSSMKSEDFFRIMVTEMQQQDPFEPTKTADMIGQVSQIRSIEQSSTLNDTLTELTRNQRVGGASDLIGKYVIASTPTGSGDASLVDGVVTGVSFGPDGAASLELDNGLRVPMSGVTNVMTVEEAEARLAAAGQTPTSGANPEDAKSEATSRGRDPLSWLEKLFFIS